MDKQSRRDLVRDYKERKSVAGVYAVRCVPSGEVWTAGSRNIDAQQTSLWFGLRNGGHINRGMQASWTAHGEAAFSFEVLERIDDEALTPQGALDRLKVRQQHWLETLGAKKAVG
jgi:hypothetical protein